MKNHILTLLLHIAGYLLPLILIIVVPLFQKSLFSKKLGELGQRSVEALPRETKERPGKKFLLFAYVIALGGFAFMAFGEMPVGLFLLTVALFYIIAGKSSSLHTDNAAAYEKGLITNASIIPWNDLHSFSREDDEIRLRTTKGRFLSYDASDALHSLLLKNDVAEHEF